jgi:hypothetical protein
MLVSALLIFYNLILAFAMGLIFIKLVSKSINQVSPVIHPTLVVLSGWVFMAMLLQSYHLFFRVDGYAHVFIVVCILLALSLQFKSLLKDAVASLHAISSKQHIAVGVMMLVLVVLNIVQRKADGDIGDYHLQAIRWIEEYAAVPGLGNIRRQLGNNSNWFLLNAFSGTHFWGLRSLYTLNAGLVIMVALFVTPHLKQRFWLRNFILLLYFTVIATRKYTGAVTNDLIITSGIVLLFSWFVDLMDTQSVKHTELLLLAFLALGLITFKLSALPLGIFAVGVLWILYKHVGFKFKSVAVILVFVLLLFMPWFTHNVINSGYLLFPVKGTNIFAVDWQMRPEIVNYEVYANLAYARAPQVDIEVARYFTWSQWWPYWIASLDVFSLFLMVGGVGFILVLGVQLLINPTFKQYFRKHQYWIIAVTCLAALYLWFTHGPTPRFVFGYLVFLIAMGLGLINRVWMQQLLHKHMLNLCLVFMGVMLLLQVKNLVNQHKVGAVAFFPPQYDQPQLKPFDVSGGIIYVPVTNQQCWDALLPCSNLPDSSLQFRGATLQQGFSIKAN